MGWFRKLMSGDVGGAFEDATGNITSGVSNLGRSIDDVVNEIPGGWATVGLATGVYYSPEIGAYIDKFGAPVSAETASAAANQTALANGIAPAADFSAAAPSLGYTPPVAGPGVNVASTIPTAGLAEATTPVSSMIDPYEIYGSGANQWGYNVPTANVATDVGIDPYEIYGSSPTVAGSDAMGADNIDIGGGYNPATGAGDTATRNAAILTGTTSSAGIPYGAGGMGMTINGMVPGGSVNVGGGKGIGLNTGLGLNALANILGNYANVQGIKEAMAETNKGAERAGGTLGDIFNYQKQIQQPYMDVGRVGLTGLTNNADYFQRQFTPEDFAAGIDPGYAFRLKQGQMAAQRAGNLKGMTGNVLTGLQDYTQGLASQEYQNAFNRFQSQRQNIYNTLSGIAGIGQGATNQLTGAGSSYGKSLADIQVAQAQAAAAAAQAEAQQKAAASQALGNAALLSGLLGQGGSTPVSSGGSSSPSVSFGTGGLNIRI